MIRRIIIPRYHQLTVTWQHLNAVREEGPGWRYLMLG